MYSNVYLLFFFSVMSFSESSCKRRKLDLSWESIIAPINIPQDLKDTVIASFVSFSVSPHTFSSFHEGLKEALCVAAGVEGWSAVISEQILMSECGLPSPSRMTWEDVNKVLVGEIPKPTQEETMVMINQEEIKAMKKRFDFSDTTIEKYSEADASARVLVLLLEVVQNIQEVKVSIKCQPTLSGHSTFSDYLINVIHPNKLMIIEVKKFSVTCNLSLPSNEVAQVLREVQILMGNHKHRSSVTFVLTNSMDWSFGVAERSGEKVKVVSTCHYNTAVQDITSVYQHFKACLAN